MSKFDIKDQLDKLIYGLYNFGSELKYNIDFNSKRAIKKNIKFKDVHAGERCFILGTGPSLKLLTAQQRESLRKETLFGVNSLYKSDIGRELSPKYYVLMDNLYWEQWSSTFTEVSNQYKDCPPIFITDLRAKYLVESLPVKNQAVYIYSKKYPVNQMSADIDENIYAAMNVISYSILSAIYMGFREIYLLGCDYSAFCTAGKGHCYDDESEISQSNYNLAFYLRFYWITTEFHYLIAKLAKEKGVKVVNLTQNSLLDAYPRLSVSDTL